MPILKFTKLGLVIGVALSGIMLAVAPSQAQTRIIMSNDNNSLGVKGQTFEVLKREIEERLGEQVDVQLHHSGALFDQRTQVQGLQLGSAHIIAPTSGIYAPVAPNLNALALPFLLSTPAAIEAAMEDPQVRATIVPALEATNITPIAIWLNGPRDLAYRGQDAILEPEQMRGVKIRVQSVPVDIETMEVLGANVVSMSWSEVPTAVQQGVIDAVEPTPNALIGAGLHEMVDQVTTLSYQYSFYIVGANKDWWEGLSDDVRSEFQEALDVATAWNWENTELENAAAYEQFAALGKPVHDLTSEQRAAWAAAVEPVWKKYGDDVLGEDVMARLREISEANR